MSLRLCYAFIEIYVWMNLDDLYTFEMKYPVNRENVESMTVLVYCIEECSCNVCPIVFKVDELWTSPTDCELENHIKYC